MTTSSQEQLIRELRDDLRIFRDKCTTEKKRLLMDIERTKSDIINIRRHTEAARLAKQAAAKQEAIDDSELAKYEELQQNLSRMIKKTRLALQNTKATIKKEQEQSDVLNNNQDEVDITGNMIAMMALLEKSDSLLNADTESVDASFADLEDKMHEKQQSVVDIEKEMAELKKEWDGCGFMGWRSDERNELLKTIYEETKALNKKYIMRRLELNTANRALVSRNLY